MPDLLGDFETEEVLKGCLLMGVEDGKVSLKENVVSHRKMINTLLAGGHIDKTQELEMRQRLARVSNRLFQFASQPNGAVLTP